MGQDSAETSQWYLSPARWMPLEQVANELGIQPPGDYWRYPIQDLWGGRRPMVGG